MVYSHDVVFNESYFPYLHKTSTSNPSSEPEHYDFLDYYCPIKEIHITDSPSKNIQTLSENKDEFYSASQFSNSDLIPTQEIPSSVIADLIVPSEIVKGELGSDQPAYKEKSKSKHSYSYQPRHVTAAKDVSSKVDSSNILPTQTRRSAQAPTTTHSCSISTQDPCTYSQAISQEDIDHWMASIARELTSLKDMEVVEECELPSSCHALATTWVFKQKTGPSGELTEFKARLCARGFSQVEGMDDSDTYAPTVRLSSLRTCLSISATKDLEIIQMDAVGAFLNGTPDTTLYIKPPQGYACKIQGNNIVLQLKKSLYGLKQSPCCWYTHLKEFFVSINFTPSKADPCVFISNDPDWVCGVHVHVDDLCIFGRDTNRFKTLINKRFTMEDLGECTFFLGIQLTRNRSEKTITLHRDK